VGLLLAAVGLFCWAFLELTGPAPVPWESVLVRTGVAWAMLWLRHGRRRSRAYFLYPGLHRRYGSGVAYLHRIAEALEQLAPPRGEHAGRLTPLRRVSPVVPPPAPVFGERPGGVPS
jgi:hypothetical protein